MANGEAESTRTRLLRECIERVEIAETAAALPSPSVCACTPPVPLQTTPNERSFILDRAVACPLTFTNPNASVGCQPVYTTPIPPLTGPGTEPPQGPAVYSVSRKMPRIRGIEEICKPLGNRAASGRTASLRANIISATQTRYVQTVIPIVPYPPCLPPSPQPGVPIAPLSPCNPGKQRVDFSNPTAH